MTQPDPPEWATKIPNAPVHSTPARQDQFQMPDGDQIAAMRAQLIDTVMQQVTLAIKGLLTPGPPGAAFAQLKTWSDNLAAALNTFITTGNWNPLLTALFGTPTVGTTIQPAAVPGIDASKIVSGLVSLGVLPQNIPQSYISGLTSALNTFITTGNWNPLLNVLFGGTTINSTIQPAAVPGIDGSKVTSGFIAPAFLGNVLGGTNLGSDITALRSSATAQQNAQATLLHSWQTTLNTAGQSQAAKISAMESAWTTYQAANSSIVAGQAATVSQIISELLGYDPATGLLEQSYVAGLQDALDQFSAAVAGDTASSGPWAWLAQFVNGYYAMTGQAHTTSVDNANTLGIRNNMPVYNGLDNTSVANMPLTAVNTVPGSANATLTWSSTSSAQNGSLVRFPAADSRGSISFIVGKSTTTASWPTSFFVNAYRWNAATQKLTYLFSSTNLSSAFPTISSTTPQWMQWVFPTTIAVAAGDVLAFGFQASGLTSPDQFFMYGMPPSSSGGMGNHPTAVLSNLGFVSGIATAGVHASGDLTLGVAGSTGWAYTKVAPYVSAELAGLVTPTYPPNITPYTVSGSQVLESWVKFVDLVGVGGGGGGQGETGGTVGRGGSPGAWNGRTLTVGTDIPAGATITVTVAAAPPTQGTSDPGSGGAYFGDGQDAAATTVQWLDMGGVLRTLTCAGGLGGGLHNGSNATTYGQGPGNYTFPTSGPAARTYLGGAAALTPQPGNPPGGSGPGGQPFQYGFNGARGQGWVVERYS